MHLDLDPSELTTGLTPLRLPLFGAEEPDAKAQVAAAIFLADTAANGAGYAVELGQADQFERMLKSTLDDLRIMWDDADHTERCDTSCPDCLRSYDNSRKHALLDWRLALDMLELSIGTELTTVRSLPTSAKWMDTAAGASDRIEGRADRGRSRRSLETGSASCCATPCGAWTRLLHRRAGGSIRRSRRAVQERGIGGHPLLPAKPTVDLDTPSVTEAPRRPHPTPLEYITPTQLGDGGECLWRLGFSRDPAVSTLSRSSPASALGSAAHEVMSKMGEPRDFESVWSEAVSKAESTLARDWEPATVPSPENWPGWSLTKVRIHKSWERSMQTSSPGAAHRGSASSGGSQLPPLPWRERWLRHPHLQLAGRPDLVERVKDEIWVVDLKTGLKQDEPTSAQRTQLLIYCGLVEGVLGQLPSHAAVQTTRGDRHAFSVDGHEVQAVIDAALETLDRLNTSGAGGLRESLANPSAEACSWCAFRPACRPFFDTYDETWPIPHALLFEVQSTEHSPHGYSLQAIVHRPRWRSNEEVHMLGFPFKQSPRSANFGAR